MSKEQGMSRDELNKVLDLKLDVQNQQGKRFKVITNGSYSGQNNTFTYLVFYRKIKVAGLGRVRCMDLTSFTKNHVLAV